MQLPSANIARSPMRLCAIAARTAVQLRISSLPRLGAQSIFLRFKRLATFARTKWGRSRGLGAAMQLDDGSTSPGDSSRARLLDNDHRDVSQLHDLASDIAKRYAGGFG
jgi:hypothetical protein